MSRPTPSPASDGETERAAAVEAFLRDHPDFLVSRPHLYAVLAPPRRVHGERLADHMAAMVEQARAREAVLVATRRAEAKLAERVRCAVLGLLAARCRRDAIETVEHDWPALFAADVVSIAVEGGSALSLRHLPRGFVRRTLGGQAAFVRETPTEIDAIYGEAAGLVATDAIARLTIDGSPGLLGFGWRDRNRGGVSASVDAFAFLARAIEAALARGP